MPDELLSIPVFVVTYKTGDWDSVEGHIDSVWTDEAVANVRKTRVEEDKEKHSVELISFMTNRLL